MTTSNSIIIDKLEDVIYVPLEAINVQSDSINYVYLANRKKQEVKLGVANANDVVIEMGLREGQNLFLSTPKWSENMAVSLLEEMNGKRNPDLSNSVSENTNESEERSTRRRSRTPGNQ